MWDHLPRELQESIIKKNIKLYVIDAYKVAKDTGMGVRINTIMQTCFFAISGVLPRDEAIEKIKESIKATYGRRGEAVVQQNFAAVDHTLSHLFQVDYPKQVTSKMNMPPVVPAEAPEFVQNVTAEIMANRGEELPVSAFPIDGTWPSATTQWEKRNIALEIPIWDPSICIQCGKCALVCPHATIRTKVYSPAELASAPQALQERGLQEPRPAGHEVHRPGGARRLHGLRALRRGVPRQGQEQPAAQGDQHGRAGAASLRGARQLGLLREPARARPDRRSR